MEIPLAELISAMATRQPDLSEFLNKNLFIRTVTYHYTGRVVDVSSAFLKLERAAWIANSGRWQTLWRLANSMKLSHTRMKSI